MASTEGLPEDVPPTPTKIHLATRATDGTGGVIKGAEIDQATANSKRQEGLDIVVCGDDLKANRVLARTIETSVGPCVRQPPHFGTAGSLALPHFQQRTAPPAGHSFYETSARKARRVR